MARQYYVKQDPSAPESCIVWLKMNGQEFYRFITSPEGRGRYFVDMDDIVIEASKEQYEDWRREKDHSNYLREQEEGSLTLSLHSDAIAEYGNGEDVLVDETVNVEIETILSMEKKALRTALSQLDRESYRLIHCLFFSKEQTTERELAADLGVSQNAIHKRKKKILKTLKFLVVKSQKSSQ